MKALLDENMPRSLVRLLSPEIEAQSVQENGWSGRRNGELLALAADAFDLYITTDQGIPHQQNLGRFEIGIMLLEAPSNRAHDLSRLVSEVKRRANSAKPGIVIRVAG